MKRKLGPGEAGGEPGAERPAVTRTGTQILEPAGLPPAARSALKRTLTSLNLAEHPDLPAGAVVRLHPRLEVGADGLIKRLVISRLQRTPSPFGSRMGDHTVACQTIVDSVHSMVHGRTVPAAALVLLEWQKVVSSWMGDPDSHGMKLLNRLEDRAERTLLLEDAGWRVGSLLARQPATPEEWRANLEERRANLEAAIAHHLAYVSYLPFATVPAKSARGSRGSGEGTYRAHVLALEESGAPDLVPPASADVGGPEGMKAALWRLFAFDAAIRAADLAFALRPGAVADVVKTNAAREPFAVAAVAAVAARDVVLLTRPFATNRSARARERAADAAAGLLPPVPVPALGTAQVLQGLAPYLAAPDDEEGEYTALHQLARKIREAAELAASAPDPVTADDHKAVEDAKLGVSAWLAEAAQLEADLRARTDALRGAAEILAHLLHDHQVTVAQAYPYTVKASRFLGPDATSAAVDRLADAVRDTVPRADPDLCAKLLDAVRDIHPKLQPTPQPARTNGWVAVAATTELAVTFPTGGPLRTTGRAPTPAGVAGMGLHTTAWVVERLAADALASGAEGGVRGVPAALRGQAVRDLKGQVMTLDWLLPTEQLLAGQLRNVFDTALDLFDATDVPAAATAYLTFRNLLPYATVDAGDRGGHGESMNASKEDLFDRKSLQTAAGLKSDELMDVRRRPAAARALAKVARRLRTQANPDWALQADVRDAVAASIVRLTDASVELSGGVPDGPALAVLIEEVRSAEHDKAYKLAETSRLRNQA
ncbi:hypothetical protein JK364_39660 [Streptomyces sp. 110]|uniref:Uncharacterized protein n=1 Tax=Streptomyces endocoffeicus TaxID=2898945 RepID=A0ABS1Q1H0_9ACTN|nr:hypothetical protein [Streptomyces endocoffeicus]MBL1118439.1 hypothetical protein [Streptomyces endocoffeicus]